MSGKIETLIIITFALSFVNMFLFSAIIVWLQDVSKRTKDIADKQFDADQVLKLYQQKYVKPIVYQDRADVKELRYDIRLPYDHIKIMGSEDEIIDTVKKDIAKEYATQIMPFIDYQIDKDVMSFEMVFRSRLRVVSK